MRMALWWRSAIAEWRLEGIAVEIERRARQSPDQ